MAVYWITKKRLIPPLPLGFQNGLPQTSHQHQIKVFAVTQACAVAARKMIPHMRLRFVQISPLFKQSCQNVCFLPGCRYYYEPRFHSRTTYDGHRPENMGRMRDSLGYRPTLRRAEGVHAWGKMREATDQDAMAAGEKGMQAEPGGVPVDKTRSGLMHACKPP